jgi:hypothetical protein
MAIPCFLASVYSMLPLTTQILPTNMPIPSHDLDEAMSIWSDKIGYIVPAISLRGKQKSWSDPMFSNILRNLQSNVGSFEDKARLLSHTQPESGCWLSCLPSRSLGNHLDNESFRIACGLRLGTDLCLPHRCRCGAAVSSLGLHGLACKKSAGRRPRHDSCNDIIARALRSAGIPSIKEPPGCSRNDGKRPDGLTLIPWSKGKSLVWDFTCRDTFAPSYLNSTSRFCGHAAEKAETSKGRKYDFLKNRFIFTTIALETSGVFGQEGLRFLRQIGGRLSEVTGEKRSLTFLLQRIAIAVQRGNAASIIGTLPHGKGLDEIYYL